RRNANSHVEASVRSLALVTRGASSPRSSPRKYTASASSRAGVTHSCLPGIPGRRTGGLERGESRGHRRLGRGELLAREVLGLVVGAAVVVRRLLEGVLRLLEVLDRLVDALDRLDEAVGREPPVLAEGGLELVEPVLEVGDVEVLLLD